MKIPSAIDITKKIKSVEWIQDRTKQEIDATREITDEDTESEVADLFFKNGPAVSQTGSGSRMVSCKKSIPDWLKDSKLMRS